MMIQISMEDAPMRLLRAAAGYYYSFSFTYFGKAYGSLAAKERAMVRV
jgi:hypothetical protein